MYLEVINNINFFIFIFTGIGRNDFSNPTFVKYKHKKENAIS